MKVIMDAPEKVHSYSPNIDRGTTVYSDSESPRMKWICIRHFWHSYG